MGKLKRLDLSFGEVFKIVQLAIFSAFLGLFICRVLVVNAEINSGSMENTLETGSRCLAIRPYYLIAEPARNDIVVFRYPDDESQLFVKRIIGMPGEKVEIISGKVYINDSETPLDDSYIPEAMGGSFGPYVVPEGKYFMLGDNRNESKDSRYWYDKFVSERKILGKVFVVYYPEMKFFL